MLCVHGNPTWSYLWRHLAAHAPPGWRVVAPDALGMGWSERLDRPRTLAARVADLGTLTAELGLEGPVVTVAHDWGGPISLGWGLAHPGLLRGIVLFNTAVHQLPDTAPPAVIRLARSSALRAAVCVRTPAFVRGTTALAAPRLARDVRLAFAAPYATAARRQAVGDFVADIPLEADHPSRPTLELIRDGLSTLANVPTLLLWGPCDPVFSDRHLRDVMARLPHADVHRYEGAGHLVTEDAPQSAGAVARWITDTMVRSVAGPVMGTQHADARAASDAGPRRLVAEDATRRARPVWAALSDRSDDATRRSQPVWAALSDRSDDVTRRSRPVWAALSDRSADAATAIMELGPRPRQVSFARLAERVRQLGAGLAASGVRPGQRVALLVPPGPDLAAALYACWRIGAVVVLADAGLGLRSLGRALRGAGPDHVIGVPRGLAAAAAMRVPGRRIAVGAVSPAERRLLRVTYTLGELAELGRLPAPPLPSPLPSPAPLLPSPQLVDGGWFPGPETNRSPAIAERGEAEGGRPADDADCAVIFTSGATGPAKGVVYRHGQVRAQLEALRRTYGITPEDKLVAAFAPFALYGPLLGITSAVPDVDVTAPAALTAQALAAAVEAIEATVVFASPSALRNVVATAASLDPHGRAALCTVRLVMSAGAPVPLSLLRAVRELMPTASLHTPYGMTEVLPVADISLDELEAVGAGNGVCVGAPVAGVEVGISRMTPDGAAEAPPIDVPDFTGEVCVRAAHRKDRYDRLWATERESGRDPGWHRTSDVGHLDPNGRLWVEGRLAHVVVTADGVVTPVGVEQRVESLADVRSAAVVGVGPRGTQQVVVVVVPAQPARGPLADAQLTAAVRESAGVTVAAVLVTPALPVDIRHQSKIDRVRVGRWAERVLSGACAPRTP